jgi:hypothetical protein
MMTLLVGGMLFQTNAYAQAVVTAVDCKEERLAGAERAICAEPELLRLTDDIDQLTKRLEKSLKAADKAALVDTEGPFMVQRNNCQNERPDVRQCVERVLTHRRNALDAALVSRASIRSELTQYTFFDIPYFLKYGDLLVGKRIHVFGCMGLDHGTTAAERLHGTIRDSCTKKIGPFVPVIFKSMDEGQASFFDTVMPSTHWEGVVERRDGRLVLAMSEGSQ